jgi:protein TonB
MNNLLLLLFCVFSLTLKAQETTKEIVTATPDIELIVVEEQPIFPGCENVSKNERLNCFNQKISEHIAKHLRYPREAARRNIQEKVFIAFIVTKDGTVEIQNINCTFEGFKDEIKRIFKKLPLLIPGKQKGENVPVSFNFPINFKLR